MREELLKGLTEEQIAKVKACKSSEEILALAKAEGVTLSEEQLEAVSGGCGNPWKKKCPRCGSGDVTLLEHIGLTVTKYRCNNCQSEYSL